MYRATSIAVLVLALSACRLALTPDGFVLPYNEPPAPGGPWLIAADMDNGNSR